MRRILKLRSCKYLFFTRLILIRITIYGRLDLTKVAAKPQEKRELQQPQKNQTEEKKKADPVAQVDVKKQNEKDIREMPKQDEQKKKTEPAVQANNSIDSIDESRY